MNKFIFTLLLLVFSSISISKENANLLKLQGSKELPLELNLMLDSLQSSKNNNESLVLGDMAIKSILQIDAHASLLSKEDIFLIGKIEIYKTLLKSSIIFPKAIIDGDSLITLKEGIRNSTDGFITWFLKALLHDCEALLATPTYKEYLLQKHAGKLEKIESRKIDKKVQLLYRWVSKINPAVPDFQEILKNELTPSMYEALKNIEQSFFIMTSSNALPPVPHTPASISELKYFSIKKVNKTAPKIIEKEKSVEDILDSITNEGTTQTSILPTPSTEDWSTDDNAPSNLKNLPKPSDDADWLQDF